MNNPSLPYFEQNASQWDALRTGYFNDEVRNTAFAKAHLHPDMLAADVGAGTGYVSAGLAPLVKKVHLVDGSAAMLEKARQNLAGHDNLEFHLADGLHLPLPNASLDVVFANMYLHHCPNPQTAIHEMARCLRPGGRLVITDLDAHNHTWMLDEMADQWPGFEREQIRGWFHECGFVNVLVDCTGQSCQAQEHEQTSISIFVASATKRITARESVQASYTARALSGGSCCDGGANCCSPGLISLEEIGSVLWDGGYSSTDTNGIPSETADFSLGCGNPLAMASLQKGETVLDIGSGGGLDAMIAARQVGPTGRVIGVDMTPAMLQRAREAAKKASFDNIKFRHGYAEKLPVENDSVDVIISNCVINLSEDKDVVFREAHRALRPNGRLEVSDMVFGGNILPEKRSSSLGWSECISGALPESEYIDLVRQAGFVQIQVRASTSQGTSAGVPVYSIQLSARKA